MIRVELTNTTYIPRKPHELQNCSMALKRFWIDGSLIQFLSLHVEPSGLVIIGYFTVGERVRVSFTSWVKQ